MKSAVKLLKPYRLSIAAALGLTLIELTVELSQPLLMARIIDDGIMKKSIHIVLIWGGVMAAISLAAFLSGMINSFFSAHVSQGYGFDLRRRLFEKIQRFSVSDFDFFQTSSLITRLTNDVTQLQNSIFMGLRIMLRAPLLVITGMIMALFVNFKLAMMLVLGVPFLLVFLYWLMNRGFRMFHSAQNRLDAVNGVMRENLLAIRLIRVFLRQKYEVGRFAQANEALRDRTIAALKLMETAMPVLLMVMNTCILFILWYGRAGVISGEAKVGEVVAIINYATRIIGAFSTFSFIIMAFSRAKASASRISEVLDMEAPASRHQETQAVNKPNHGRLTFEHVGFCYPGSDTPVLGDISFTVQPGQTVAVLGATGSGKTTMLQLIPRLFEASSGRILLDDEDIRLLQPDSLRNQIGYVPQEVVLFSGMVKDNIKWGKADASMKEIIQAAKDAQIHQTIMALPKQYDTLLGQRGVNLSGGQKQRLSIARSLIRKPGVLLLDDCTSALDLRTEADLMEALRAYACTTLIITQKISTAEKSDSVILLEAGALLAAGTHEDLMNRCELYRKIYQSQYGSKGVNVCSRS